MALFDRFAPVLAARARVRGDDPFGVRMDRILSPTEAIVRGRPVLLAGTNNYLGLTFDPDCIAAARNALERLGTGTTGSSIANGSYAGHKDLEAALADFYGREHAMVFSTGYQANLGIISTLAGPQDYLLIDADCHASIYDACRMGSATVIRFRHNDAADLDRRLRRLADHPGNKIVVVEGIYSMLGDQAPLAEIAEVKTRHGAYLIVDEAHSLGVLGRRGRGLAEAAGVEDAADFVVGTFSKSLGAVGGFCVSNHPEFEILRVVSRPYMFTASLPPSVIASVRKALEIVATRPELRTRLWALSNHFYDRLTRHGFQLGPQKGPVVAVHLPDVPTALAVWQELLDAGVYVNMALPPATPTNQPLLRCSVCAAHTAEQLDRITDLLTDVAYEVGMFEQPARVAVG
jgi:8-amino-7-oxononanoate synthase